MGQGVSQRPASYLGRCQQTGPHAGVPGKGAGGRQGGTRVCKHSHVGVGVTGGDDNTVRYTHRVQESGEMGWQQRQGPLTALTVERRAGAGGQLTGMSQVPNCARLGLAPAQSSGVPGTLVAHWANTCLTHPPGQAPCLSSMAWPGVTREPWGWCQCPH